MPVVILRPSKLEGRVIAPSFHRIPENEDAMKRWIADGKERSQKAARVKKSEPREAKMIRVRMLRTRPGGIDGGMRVVVFHAGKVYCTDGSGDGYIDVPLAEAFLRCGHAEEDKMLAAAPETKAEVMIETPKPVAARKIKRGKK